MKEFGFIYRIIFFSTRKKCRMYNMDGVEQGKGFVCKNRNNQVCLIMLFLFSVS